MTDPAGSPAPTAMSIDGAPARPPSEPRSPAAERRRSTDGIELRALRSHADYQACVELQRETWGASFSERVPPTILMVSQRIGGVTAGAFDGAGRMLGFVFGMTGVEPGGRIVHWSDMLAVREEARDLGVGTRLKRFQREALLPLGVEVVYWTYDPLVARNAHLNLNRLGARVVEYVVDMYGAETESELHRGLGTDRFVVAWSLAEPAPRADDGGAPAPVPPGGEEGEGSTWIEIPADIRAVQAASLARAAEWRAATRAALVERLARGAQVTGFHRDPESGRCFYHLSDPPHSSGG